MEVVICPNHDDLSLRAARIVAELIRAKPDAVLGLPIGSTPIGLYRELVRMHPQEGLSFAQVRVFNLIEYVGLGPEHPQSSHRFMHQYLFDHVDIRPDQVYAPSGLAMDLDAHCLYYEQQIADCGGIDLLVLGIGTDGHIAFNEPGSSFNSRTRRVALARQTIDDNARFFPSRQHVPMMAVSLGIGTILDARRILLLANGPNKAGILAAAVEGMVNEMCPASALQLHDHITVLADESAASKLTATATGR
ncbi:MAG: glucosamine-6-phosphate deaminase [Planctomycetes bacterium]|nr:glucosamine-6-phosphate deaminase [Planctomycetota bacterium]